MPHYKLAQSRNINKLTMPQASELAGIPFERWSALEHGHKMTEEELYRVAITLGVETDFLTYQKTKSASQFRFAKNTSRINGHAKQAYGFDVSFDSEFGHHVFQVPVSENPTENFQRCLGDRHEFWFEFSAFGAQWILVNAKKIKNFTVTKRDNDAIPDAAFELYGKFLQNDIDEETKEYAKSVIESYDLKKTFDPTCTYIYGANGNIKKVTAASWNFRLERPRRWSDSCDYTYRFFVTGVVSKTDNNISYLDLCSIDLADDDIMVVSPCYDDIKFMERYSRAHGWANLEQKYSKQDTRKTWKEIYAAWQKCDCENLNFNVVDNRIASESRHRYSWRKTVSKYPDSEPWLQEICPLDNALDLLEEKNEEHRAAMIIYAILTQLPNKTVFRSLPSLLANKLCELKFKPARYCCVPYSLPIIPTKDWEFQSAELSNIKDVPNIQDLIDIVYEQFQKLVNTYEIFIWSPEFYFQKDAQTF
jgi:hypothetical protein